MNLSFRFLLPFLGILMPFTLLAEDCPTHILTFTTQAEIDSFRIQYPNCSHYPNEIRIKAPSVTNLAGLQNLEEIQGGLTVDGCRELRNFQGLNKLRKVPFIDIKKNPRLESLDGLEHLEQIHSPYLSRLLIIDCPNLHSVSALRNVTRLSGLVIKKCPKLVTLAEISDVTQWGYFQIQECDNLIYLPPLNQHELGKLTLHKLPSFGGFVGFDSLRSIGMINLQLIMLRDFKGLDNLEKVGGIFNVEQTPIRSFAGLESLKEVGRSLLLQKNPLLKDVSGLANLQRIGTGFLLVNSNGIQDLSPMRGLQSVGEITIQSNANLRKLGPFHPSILKGSSVFKVSGNHPDLGMD